MKKFVFLVLSFVFLLLGSLILFYTITILPNIDILNTITNKQSAIITDRDGNILFDFEENERRQLINYDELSPVLINTIIATEDKNFFDHGGIELPAFLRALFINVQNLSFEQGGSTITQQTVKNIFLTRSKTIVRKFKEFVLAYRLEREISKEQILELYLNTISYGGTIYGIKAATQAFFDKDPKDINLVEAAYLAAIPKAPTYYSPYGKNRNELEKRKNYVLKLSFDLDFINNDEYREATNTIVYFKERDLDEQKIKAPHFVFYVKKILESEIGSDLHHLYGKTIKTTLDLDLQSRIEVVVKELGVKLEEHGINNAAALVLSVKTGDILAMIGSKDYFDKEIDGSVNIIDSKRQIGSTIKPFIYAAAFEKGLTADTVVLDVETEFNPACELEENEEETIDKKSVGLLKLGLEINCYTPKNFNDTFSGPVSLREALAQSRNIPTLKLLYLVSLPYFIDLLSNLGITIEKNIFSFGLTLGLGSQSTTPLELLSAFTVFPNEGTLIKTNSILDKEFINKSEAVILSKLTTQTVNDILSDDEARSPVFGRKSLMYFDEYDVAVKTGTTSWSRDLWVVGYSQDIAVVVWGGNTKGEIIFDEVTGFTLMPYFRKIIDMSLDKYGNKNNVFRQTEYVKTTKPILHGEYIGDDGKPHSILHYIDRNDFNEDSVFEKDQQYENWEKGVVLFFKNLNISF